MLQVICRQALGPASIAAWPWVVRNKCVDKYINVQT